MKKSYLLPLAISVTAFFCNATAFAQSWTQCKAFEFAEMQFMNKTELEQLYCKNMLTMESGRKMRSSTMDAAFEAIKLGSISESNRYAKEASIYGEHRNACNAENERVLRVIKKGNDQVVAPKCE